MSNFGSILRNSLLIILLIVNIAVADNSELLSQKYIELSGVYNFLLSIPSSISTFSEFKTEGELSDETKNVITELYNFNDMKSKLSTSISINTDIDVLNEIVLYHKSEFSIKFNTAINNYLSKAKISQDEKKYLNDINSNPIQHDRLILIQKLVKSLNVSELQHNIALTTFKAMVHLKRESDKLTMPDKKVYYGYNDELNRDEGMMQFCYQIYNSMFVIVCKDMTDYEVTQLIKYYDSGIGQKEINVVIKAYDYLLKSWFVEKTNNIIKGYTKYTNSKNK